MIVVLSRDAEMLASSSLDSAFHIRKQVDEVFVVLRGDARMLASSSQGSCHPHLEYGNRWVGRL